MFHQLRATVLLGLIDERELQRHLGDLRLCPGEKQTVTAATFTQRGC